MNRSKISQICAGTPFESRSATSADCGRVLRGVLRESRYADSAAAAGLAASSTFTEALLQTSLELVCCL